MIRIRCETKSINYEFYIYGRLSVIYGESGTGKTTYANIFGSPKNKEDYKPGKFLDRLKGNGFDGDVKVECDRNVYALTEGQLQNFLMPSWEYSLDNSVVILDEYEYGTKTIYNTLIKILNKFKDCYVICIGRVLRHMQKLSVNSLYKIIRDKSTNTNHIVPAYSAQPANKDTNLIMVADSTSGFDFYKNYYKDSEMNVISCYGNSKVPKVLYILPLDYVKPYIICDALSYAIYYQDTEAILSKLGDNYLPCPSDRIFAPESFEYLVWNSNWINKRDISVPTDTIFDNAGFISEEKLYDNIFEVFKNSCGKYDKDTKENNCTLHDCGKSKSCDACICYVNKMCTCKMRIDTDKNNIILGNATQIIPQPNKVNRLPFKVSSGEFVNKSSYVVFGPYLIKINEKDSYDVYRVKEGIALEDTSEYEVDDLVSIGKLIPFTSNKPAKVIRMLLTDYVEVLFGTLKDNPVIKNKSDEMSLFDSCKS